MANIRPLKANQAVAIKALIKNGRIRDFDELFEHLKPSQIGGMMGSNTERALYIQADRKRLHLADIYNLAEQLGVTYIEMCSLLVPEEEKLKPKPKRKK